MEISSRRRSQSRRTSWPRASNTSGRWGLIVRREARYALTEKGLDLLPAMLDLIGWSGKYDPRTGAPKEFLKRIARDREGLLKELTARLRAEYGL